MRPSSSGHIHASARLPSHPLPCPALPAGNTLSDNADFWSSSGNPNVDSEEFLVYKMAHPLCTLHSVTIGIYRAQYQFGCALQMLRT